MGDRSRGELDLYDHLIDAEREALSRSGRKAGKIELIRALRGATGLGLSDAKQAVETYLARRGGQVPAGLGADRLGEWIDDLLDAERAAAANEERPITKILLIKALRGATPLKLRPAKLAVEDYLRRRGGEDLPSGSDWVVGVLLVFLAAAAIGAGLAIAWAHR